MKTIHLAEVNKLVYIMFYCALTGAADYDIRSVFLSVDLNWTLWIDWGDWKRGSGQRGMIEYAGVENAGVSDSGKWY